MFYVDWDIYNNESSVSNKKNILNGDDDDLIYKKIIKAVAVYVKEFREKAIILLSRYGYDKTNNEEEIVTGIITQLYDGTKDFRDGLATELIKLKLLEDSSMPLLVSAIVTGKIGLQEKNKKDEQAKKAKQEILGAIAQEKGRELQINSKKGQVKTVVTALIIILIIIGLICLWLKTRKKTIKLCMTKCLRP